MPDNPSFHVESAAVQKHIEVMRDVIARMAENSRSCKVWCITLVAAILVLIARTGEPQHALIALIPIVLFLFLDSYYLALERAFIASQNAFVGKLNGDGLDGSDIFKVVPTGMGWRLVLFSLLGSVSILPFYVLVAATVLAAWLVIL